MQQRWCVGEVDCEIKSGGGLYKNTLRHGVIMEPSLQDCLVLTTIMNCLALSLPGGKELHLGTASLLHQHGTGHFQSGSRSEGFTGDGGRPSWSSRCTVGSPHGAPPPRFCK
jgi:hypothetical protein